MTSVRGILMYSPIIKFTHQVMCSLLIPNKCLLTCSDGVGVKAGLWTGLDSGLDPGPDSGLDYAIISVQHLQYKFILRGNIMHVQLQFTTNALKIELELSLHSHSKSTQNILLVQRVKDAPEFVGNLEARWCKVSTHCTDAFHFSMVV